MLGRRTSILVAAAGLTLAACGSSDDTSAPAATDASPETVATPVDDGTADGDAGDTPSEPAADTEPAETAASDTASSESDVDVPPTDAVATETPTDEAAPAETEPPTEEASAPEVGGRALATEVDPASQFEGNPFPDLVVEDVGRGGEANLANLLPADRPLLLWAWAPH